MTRPTNEDEVGVAAQHQLKRFLILHMAATDLTGQNHQEVKLEGDGERLRAGVDSDRLRVPQNEIYSDRLRAPTR